MRSDQPTPDAFGAVVAWRAWKISDRSRKILLPGGGSVHVPEELRLRSVSMTEEWTPRQPMEATCRSSHEPPGDDCHCGLYAAKTRAHLESMSYPNYNYQLGDPSVCIGEVWLWGGIVEGSQGWRAQFAYPKRILVPHEAYLKVADLRALYGVPVKLENTLRRAAA
jgi:hypothetical protein